MSRAGDKGVEHWISGIFVILNLFRIQVSTSPAGDETGPETSQGHGLRYSASRARRTVGRPCRTVAGLAVRGFALIQINIGRLAEAAA